MKHTMKRFDEELVALKEHVLSMGGLVERAIGHAVTAMLEQDEKLALKTIERDRAINALEVQCDEMTRDILIRR
ncbi:MAG: PhoU domain-containing protein, partial [Ghiorsea sp.]|nr:PhoU domain-containing protein [Ghiorsea sp.]